MSDIQQRLRDAFDSIAVCHCGNDKKGGPCDDHHFTWNPDPDSQLLHYAENAITSLRAQLARAVAERDKARNQLRLKIDASIVTIDTLTLRAKTAEERAGRLAELVECLDLAEKYNNSPSVMASVMERLHNARAAVVEHNDLNGGIKEIAS